jgi:Protein of unknown function (DUF2812).
MDKIIWKLYSDYEKEERWLNAMSAKGLAFTDYVFCRYKFVDCKPGEYTYRIELLENLPSHPESRQYIQFMEDNGVEVISNWTRWVYFRKKTDSVPFNIFSDIDSRITHYKRIGQLYLILGLSQLTIGISQFSSNFEFSYKILIPALIFSVSAILLLGWNSIRKKIKRLNQERQLRE